MTEIIFVFLFLGIEKNRINYECHFDAQFSLDIWYGIVHYYKCLVLSKSLEMLQGHDHHLMFNSPWTSSMGLSSV